jgi:heavy metal sensor kinase
VSLPIRVRLTAWYGVLLAATIAAISVFLVLQLQADLVDEIDEDVARASFEITRTVTGDTQNRTDPAERDRTFAEEAEEFLAPSAGAAQLLDERGRTLARFGSVVGAEPTVSDSVRAAAVAGKAQTLTVPLGDQGERYRVRVSSLRVGGQARVLVVAESLRPVENAARQVVMLLMVAGPAALLLTGLAAYWLAYKALQPVERITTEARGIGIDRLNERLAVPRPHDETGRLAVTLNAMLARIERGVVEKHRLLADASHELRTPLAIMRNEIDVALVADELPEAAREVLASAREEVDRMTRTTTNLLTSAQADEGRLELLTTPTDLRRLVDDAVRALQPLAAAKDVRLVAGGDPWEVQADPPRLLLVLTNLVDNAVKYSPSGGTVRIETWRRDEEVGVTVTDQGPGIADADAEHLFDRFYRAGNHLTTHLGGTGLGLAISREVAVAHGGRVWVERSSEGGSAFSLGLPTWRTIDA